jgi:16S rRNA (uracil1498-N3)-methyltransferase
VLRLRVGDEVSVFDGRGSGCRATIESITRGAAVVLLGGSEDGAAEPSTRVTLYQAIPHGERMDWIVEKSTELGVAAIVPVVTERGVVRPGQKDWQRLSRWRRIALSAAKQSGRLVVPPIAEPLDLATALEAPAPHARVIFQIGGAEPLAILRKGAGSGIHLLVGPEGGFTEQEIQAARTAGWAAAGMGRRVLRTDTAAAVAVALALAAAGEMAAAADSAAT